MVLQMFLIKAWLIVKSLFPVLCNTQKKYWKWPETYVLILHSYWTPQFQTFTNLLIGIFRVSNSTYFFFQRRRNYVSVIVNIVSNNSVLKRCFLWIFVSIKTLLQLIVFIGVSTSQPPPPTSKTLPLLFFFFSSPL